MKNIEIAVSATIEKELETRKADGSFQEKQSLLAKMKERGLLKPQKYGITPLDTVGKRRYQAGK